MNVLQWALSRLPRRTITGADGTPYLSRYTLLNFGKDVGRLYLHHFHRGDEDRELHSHPWRAMSVIMSGGYREERRIAGDRVVAREYRPGSVNVIAPDTFHRVDLLGRDAWTMIAVGPASQSWGFWNRETGAFTCWRMFLAMKAARATR